MTNKSVTCPHCEGAGSITRPVMIDPIPFGGNDPEETTPCGECGQSGEISQADYEAFLAELSQNDEQGCE